MTRLTTKAALACLPAAPACLLAALALTACTTPGQPGQPPMAQPASSPEMPAVAANPPAPGFDAEGSDARAIELADKAMGGRAAWDRTRYITWRFFGGRLHVWDKWTGNHRFEEDDLVVLHNIHTHEGRAWRAGEPVVDADTLAARLDRAHAAWINDAYWLVMPYKLKDSGVTLTYVEEGMTEEGLPAHIVELTFRDVGRTPQNRYRVWLDIHTGLASQWSFYRNAADEEPAFVMPWANWQPYGGILLNDDFGRRRHSAIAVFDDLPESVFTDPGEISLTE
jgi:hypothetical protein